MSSEATDRPVAPRKRHIAVQYWAFFPKEEAAFWHFGARSREDGQSQESSPQHTRTPIAPRCPFHKFAASYAAARL